MAHVAHDASVLHFVHVLARDHIFIARRCNNNVYISNDFIELHHSEAVHAVMRQHICIEFLSDSANDLVVEINRSASAPYLACKAHMGSISVIYTIQPKPLRA